MLAPDHAVRSDAYGYGGTAMTTALPDALRSHTFVPGTPLEELPPDLELTTLQAAPYCRIGNSDDHIKPGTLDKWRRAFKYGRSQNGPAWIEYGTGPKPRIRYRVSDIIAWLDRAAPRRVDPGGPTGGEE